MPGVRRDAPTGRVLEHLAGFAARGARYPAKSCNVESKCCESHSIGFKLTRLMIAQWLAGFTKLDLFKTQVKSHSEQWKKTIDSETIVTSYMVISCFSFLSLGASAMDEWLEELLDRRPMKRPAVHVEISPPCSSFSTSIAVSLGLFG